MGSCGQPHLPLLPFAYCCLDPLPVCTEPSTDRHELGKPYLWMPCCLLHDILLYVWKTYFRWTSRVLQAAVIYSKTAMGIMYGTALTLAPTEVLRSPRLHVHRQSSLLRCQREPIVYILDIKEFMLLKLFAFIQKRLATCFLLLKAKPQR